MSDAPVRSLPTSGPLARQLLESGRADQPEAGARDRALLAFGFAPLGVLAVAPPVAGAVASSPAGAVAAGSKATAWLLVGKSVAIGALGSVLAIGLVKSVVTGAAPAATPRTAPPEERHSLTAPMPSLGSPQSPPAARTTDGALDLAAKRGPKPADARSAPVGAPATPPLNAADGSSLQELDALARVRRALSAHEAGRALAMLDDFKWRFPASRVTEEAAVLRIEALSALGRKSEAETLARQFLRERPFSVYGAKISAMTGRP